MNSGSFAFAARSPSRGHGDCEERCPNALVRSTRGTRFLFLICTLSHAHVHRRVQQTMCWFVLVGTVTVFPLPCPSHQPELSSGTLTRRNFQARLSDGTAPRRCFSTTTQKNLRPPADAAPQHKPRRTPTAQSARPPPRSSDYTHLGSTSSPFSKPLRQCVFVFTVVVP